MTKYLFVLAFYLGLGSGLTGWTQDKFGETRLTIEKWVETRQLMARARSEWQVDKETLQQSINLLENEIKLLDEQIAKVEATSSEADKQRQELAQENEALLAASDRIKNVIGDLEKHVLSLSKQFPERLKEDVATLLQRIPNDPAKAKLAITHRLMNVVGILNAADLFNSRVSVVSELRKNQAGREVQVKTLYLGLAQAFFVDKSGQYAGIGRPSPEGWQWTLQNGLGDRVSQAIAIYENLKTAEFIPLPVKIQ